MKTKILILLSIWCSISSDTHSQYVYNRLYKPDSMSIAAVARFSAHNTVVGYYVTIDQHHAFCVGNYSDQGIVENLISILPNDQYHLILWGHSALEEENSLVIIGKYAGLTHYLIRYYLENDSFTTTPISVATGTMVVSAIINTQDGGYALVGGSVLDNDNDEDMFLYKVNANFEMEWYQDYDFPGSGRAHTVLEIPPASGGGFLLGGWEGLTSDPEENNNHCRVYRISEDEQQIIWSQDYDILNTTGSSADVVLNDDHSYYLSGNTGDYKENLTMYASLCSYETGEEIISKTYHGYIISGTFRNFGNGNIVGAYKKIHNTPEENDITHKPVLIRFNEEMDTLWTSTIYSIPGEDDYIRDVKHCPDGGYLITGFNYTRQAAWLVKTDSMGRTCLPADCDSTIMAISSLPIVENPYSLVLTQNPVSDLAVFTHHIPLDSQPARMEIYDLSGRVMMSRMIALQGGEIKLNISSLPRGVYVYRLHTGPIEWGTGKIMVNK